MRKFLPRMNSACQSPNIGFIDKINSKRATLTNRVRRIRQQSLQHYEEDEREQVEALNYWHNTKITGQHIERMKEAQQAFHKRMANQDIVEQEIVHRRTKSQNFRLPVLSKSQRDLIAKREERKTYEQAQKQKTRYSKRYENELADNYINTFDELENQKANREKLRSELIYMKNMLIQSNNQLDILRQEIDESEKRDKLQMRSSSAFMAQFLSKLKQLRTVYQQKELENNDLKNEISQKQSIIMHKVQLLDTQCHHLRLQLQSIRQTQVDHFKNLLFEGMDSRSKGLQWVVRKLWELGENVAPDMFPPFLDDDSVHAILFLAQQEIQLDELSNQVNQYSYPKIKNNLSKHDRWNNIQERLLQLTQSVKVSQPDLKTEKKSQETDIQWFPEDYKIESNASNFYNKNEQNETEQQIQYIKDVIKEAQTSEMRRLMRECLVNNYEQRYKVQMKNLLAAVVGVETVNRHMATLTKEQKKLDLQMKKTRTFTFTSKALVN